MTMELMELVQEKHKKQISINFYEQDKEKIKKIQT